MHMRVDAAISNGLNVKPKEGWTNIFVNDKSDTPPSELYGAVLV